MLAAINARSVEFYIAAKKLHVKIRSIIRLARTAWNFLVDFSIFVYYNEPNFSAKVPELTGFFIEVTMPFVIWRSEKGAVLQLRARKPISLDFGIVFSPLWKLAHAM